MRDDMLQFQDKMNTFIRTNQRLCYMTRAIELQKDALRGVEALKEEAKQVKAKAVMANDEEAANAILAFEHVLQTLKSELEMWVELKEDEPHKAWNCLVDSQMAALHAVRAHPVASHMSQYLKRLEALEQLLFPPQVFVSPGMIIYSAKCSICEAEYGECEHIKGRPYMGEFCSRIIDKVEFTEVSMVDDPVDKRCITFSYSSDGKTLVDRFTLRESAIHATGSTPPCTPLAIDDSIGDRPN